MLCVGACLNPCYTGGTVESLSWDTRVGLLPVNTSLGSGLILGVTVEMVRFLCTELRDGTPVFGSVLTPRMEGEGGGGGGGVEV